MVIRALIGRKISIAYALGIAKKSVEVKVHEQLRRFQCAEVIKLAKNGEVDLYILDSELISAKSHVADEIKDDSRVERIFDELESVLKVINREEFNVETSSFNTDVSLRTAILKEFNKITPSQQRVKIIISDREQDYRKSHLVAMSIEIFLSHVKNESLEKEEFVPELFQRELSAALMKKVLNNSAMVIGWDQKEFWNHFSSLEASSWLESAPLRPDGKDYYRRVTSSERFHNLW